MALDTTYLRMFTYHVHVRIILTKVETIVVGVLS